MSTAKASSRRTKKKAVRAPETPPEAAKPRWPMEERKVDPDAPYFGLSKEEFERLAFWRKVPLGPEMEQFIDWFLANHECMRAETIEYSDGRPMNFIPYDGEPF